MRYGFAVVCVSIAFIIRFLLSRFMGDALPLMLFVAAAMVASAYGGAIPGLVALVLGLLLSDFFFLAVRNASTTSHSIAAHQLFRYVFTASVGILLIEILHRNQLRIHAVVEELQREVIHRKASEGQLADAQAKLSRHAEELERRVAERTAGLEALLYHIAHNLRAPLRAMDGFARLLEEDYASTLDDTGLDYTRRICKAASSMDVLIVDLLDFGRLSHVEVNLHRADLNRIMESVLRKIADQIKAKNAEVVVNGSLPEVWANESLAERVLFNLVENALKFVAPGQKPQIHIFAEDRGAWVRLWVQDNGIGVEPEHCDRIFAGFERLHGDLYDGTGIGLAIVNRCMRRMRGRAGIESKPGKGSLFWVEFARIPDANLNS